MLAQMMVGHMAGDFLVQNDWMANNKKRSSLHCLVHCLVYTYCIWAFCMFAIPYWCLGIIFLTHFAQDRTQFVRRWMKWVGQDGFAETMKPWSVVVVDNTHHLVVLWLVDFMIVMGYGAAVDERAAAWFTAIWNSIF